MARKKTGKKRPPPKTEHLKKWHFKKGQSGNPAGRYKLPPELKSNVQEVKVKIASTFCDCMLSQQAIRDIEENDDASPAAKYVAKQVRLCVEEGSYARFEALISRVVGKPKEEVDMNVQGKMGMLEMIVQRSREKMNAEVQEAEFKEVESDKEV